MAKSAPRLGKGLTALIAPRQPQSASEQQKPAAGEQVSPLRLDLPVDDIRPNRSQPRGNFADENLRDLAESIRANGLLQPVLVRKSEDGAYELVAGERRWRAAKLAGLECVPVIIRDATDAKSLELALVENIQREDLSPLDRAAAYQRYIDRFGGTIDDLASRISESRANVSNYIRLLKLRNEARAMLASGELTMGQARAIAGVADEQRQLAIARMAAGRNLSVRQVEELARSASDEDSARQTQSGSSADDAGRRHLSDVEQALSKALGLRVRLYPGKKKNSGRIVISYSSLEEFDRVAVRIGGNAHLE